MISQNYPLYAVTFEGRIYVVIAWERDLDGDDLIPLGVLLGSEVGYMRATLIHTAVFCSDIGAARDAAMCYTD